jgi:multisubunit Na+/H+ antiporter MnhB subunit
MRTGTQVVLRGAARLHLPLIALFALSLLVARAPGEGAGMIAGLALTLALVLHVLVFGAAAARRALPGPAARVVFALGLGAALTAAGAPGLAYAAQIGEGGLFALIVGGAAQVIAVLVGRAPTLRDEAW